MTQHFESFLRGVMSGDDRSVNAAGLRLAMSVAEPVYRWVTAGRNLMFDWRVRKPRRLPAPVISVGNLTTGGTGKTPMVAWIVRVLHRAGHSPAVLMRGYRKDGQGISDEEQLYLSSFATLQPAVQVAASPARYKAALQLLQSPAPPNIFILDDGFQHRQIARDLDLLLVDATNPFGYGRVLPRGMLRESISGLTRAQAIVITRSDQVTPDQLTNLSLQMQRMHPAAPVFQSWNELEIPDSARGKKLFAFCGIGNPESFWRLLERSGQSVVGKQALGDHQYYSAALLKSLASTAGSTGAEMMITTEKDRVKIALMDLSGLLPIECARMFVRFAPADLSRLLAMIMNVAKRK